MKTSENLYKKCPFCGNEYLYKTITNEDGYDWEGHHRGKEDSVSVIHNCPCGIEKKLEECLQSIKPMCINCRYCVCDENKGAGYNCTHQKNLDKVKSMNTLFNLNVTKLNIKKETAKCEYYELSTDLNVLREMGSVYAKIH